MLINLNYLQYYLKWDKIEKRMINGIMEKLEINSDVIKYII